MRRCLAESFLYYRINSSLPTEWAIATSVGERKTTIYTRDSIRFSWYRAGSLLESARTLWWSTSRKPRGERPENFHLTEHRAIIEFNLFSSTSKNNLLATARMRQSTDGLNSLKYVEKSIKLHTLFTHVSVGL